MNTFTMTMVLSIERKLDEQNNWIPETYDIIVSATEEATGKLIEMKRTTIKNKQCDEDGNTILISHENNVFTLQLTDENGATLGEPLVIVGDELQLDEEYRDQDFKRAVEFGPNGIFTIVIPIQKEENSNKDEDEAFIADKIIIETLENQFLNQSARLIVSSPKTYKLFLYDNETLELTHSKFIRLNEKGRSLSIVGGNITKVGDVVLSFNNNKKYNFGRVERLSDINGAIHDTYIDKKPKVNEIPEDKKLTLVANKVREGVYNVYSIDELGIPSGETAVLHNSQDGPKGTFLDIKEIDNNQIEIITTNFRTGEEVKRTKIDLVSNET